MIRSYSAVVKSIDVRRQDMVIVQSSSRCNEVTNAKVLEPTFLQIINRFRISRLPYRCMREISNKANDNQMAFSNRPIPSSFDIVSLYINLPILREIPSKSNGDQTDLANLYHLITILANFGDFTS